MTWKEYTRQFVTISPMPPTQRDFIKSNWNYCQDITIYYKETDRMYFYIHFKDFIPLLPKFASNFTALSLMLKEDYLLVHGMLLSNGDVLFGQAFSGKTTLSKKLDQNEGDLKALCDDQVLIDLKNNTAYPLPYYYFDPTGLFNGKQTEFNPVPINRVLMLKKGTEDFISNVSSEQYLDQLYKCSIVFLSQPFAQREQVFACQQNKRWICFQKGMEQKVKNKIKQLIQSYFSNKLKQSFTFHI